MDTVNNVISSLDSGLSYLVSSISGLFGEAKVRGDEFKPLGTTFDFFKDGTESASNFLFGEPGLQAMESEDGISAMAGKAPTKGIFEKTVDFTQKSPQVAKLGAGLINGAYQAYQKDKDRESAEALLKQKSDYEKQLLREKYDYQNELDVKNQNMAFGAFKGAGQKTNAVPYGR